MQYLLGGVHNITRHQIPFTIHALRNPPHSTLPSLRSRYLLCYLHVLRSAFFTLSAVRSYISRTWVREALKFLLNLLITRPVRNQAAVMKRVISLTRLVCSQRKLVNNVKCSNVFNTNGTIMGPGVPELSKKFSTFQNGLNTSRVFGSPGIELKKLSFMHTPYRPFSKVETKVVKEEKKENEIYKKIKEAGMTYAPVERRNRQDHYRRHMAAKYEVERRLYKAIARDEHLPDELRDQARLKLSQFPKNSSFTRIRNRCIITGRPRAVYRRFKISRLVLRELARAGELTGVTKASW